MRNPWATPDKSSWNTPEPPLSHPAEAHMSYQAEPPWATSKPPLRHPVEPGLGQLPDQPLSLSAKSALNHQAKLSLIHLWASPEAPLSHPGETL